MSTAPGLHTDLAANGLTIEQLAAETGMSVRNIRAHQARGLLAPPEVRMRVGYYGREHVAQLRLIRELQEQGFNLGGIKRLLDEGQGTAERLSRLGAALAEPHGAEQAQTLTLAELAKRFRISRSHAPGVLAQAERLGVLVPAGEDRFQAPRPSLLAVAEEVAHQGIPLPAVLEVLEEIERLCDTISRTFVTVFLREVWNPFIRDGMPEERWPQIEEAIARLRPLAADALGTIFQQRMDGQVELAFGDIGPRLAGEAG